MSDDKKPDFLDWLGLPREPDWSKARWLGVSLSLVGSLGVATLFLLAIAAAIKLLGGALFGELLEQPGAALGVGGVTVALIGAPFVIWRSIVAQKTVNVQEQGQITDRINKAVEGLGAEKTVKVREFVPKYKTKDKKREKDADGKYIPLLRGDGTPQGRWEISEETQPNLEVRIGAIYALERIAQDSDRDHVQIMEILCAYIRQNAPAPEEDDWPELEMKESEEDGPLEADWNERVEAFQKAQREAKAKLKPREDIQVALTVIGRRSAEQRRIEAGPGRGEKAAFPFDDPPADYDGPEDGHDPEALKAYRKKLNDWTKELHRYESYRLDLRDTDLRGTDLSRAELGGARLDGARLQGAVLREARLQGANLRRARLEGGDLREARMQGAVLKFARMQEADLREARLQGADLWLARMQGANLGRARMQGADLREARLQGAVLRAARLQRANLSEARFDPESRLSDADLDGAAVNAVDFTNIPQIAEHLPGMFGDASVTLPGGHGPEHESWLPHWPKAVLKPKEFHSQWRAWLEDPEGYTPPDPPKTT